MDAIKVNSIGKSYQGKKALEKVSFTVKGGEIFGLIGPDGAGKTTIFRILTTLLKPDYGTGTVAGLDIKEDFAEIRKSIGYMPGQFSLYQDLTIEENLNFFATIFNTTVADNYHLIEDIYRHIEPFKTRRAGKLSGGMKQKLALCCALIHKPKVLFLDEPTTGVDPVSRKDFWEMLGRLKEQEITILVATPYMDEASLCDRVALIQAGKILTIETPSKISSALADTLYEIKADNMYKLLRALGEMSIVKSSYAFGEFAHLIFEGKNIDKEEVRSFLISKGLKEIELRRATPSIEDSFIHYLKQ